MISLPSLYVVWSFLNDVIRESKVTSLGADHLHPLLFQTAEEGWFVRGESMCIDDENKNNVLFMKVSP
ncbi:MAG: hypothetical protein D6820_11270 [Lentisphaerae bacterium]|nr:MAG: hypothetical protein D6820_11270 [Lentisphaerota bacterium]